MGKKTASYQIGNTAKNTQLHSRFFFVSLFYFIVFVCVILSVKVPIKLILYAIIFYLLSYLILILNFRKNIFFHFAAQIFSSQLML